jgi:DNA-binding GntR family transcriptional regulator
MSGSAALSSEGGGPSPDPPLVRVRDGGSVAAIHDRLRRAILRGEIPPGEVRSQVQLASRLGVGRTPLREALRLLQHEGLVLAESNRRVRIAEFSIPDVEELYVIRICLESVAIRTTVPLLSPEDFAELEGLMAQMDHYALSKDFERLDVPHRVFHSRLVSGLGGRPSQLMAEARDHAARYRRAYSQAIPEMWQTQRAEHRGILDAAERSDTQAAATILIGHFARTARGVIKQLDPDHVPTRLETAVTILS